MEYVLPWRGWFFPPYSHVVQIMLYSHYEHSYYYHNLLQSRCRTLDSVLRQDYDDFEYIIEDSSSIDGTKDLVALYAEKFKEKGIPFYFYSEKDTGIYDGMNRAVKRAHGLFINFMNADDIFYNKHVLSNIFSKKSIDNYDLIYGDCVEEEFDKYYYFPKDFSKIRTKMPFSHQSVFVKKEHLESFPFKTSLRIGADYDFLLNCYDNELSFYDCGNIVTITTKNGVSSTDLYNTFVETVQIQKDHGIIRFSDIEYAKKLKSLKIRQWGMDHLPVIVKKCIRKVQRILRGQSQEVEINS